MKIPLLSDITKSISRDYGVLLDDSGVALRQVIQCACMFVRRLGVMRNG